MVDAQLPPSLAEALRQAECEAIHVVDLGLQAATDLQIWDEAISRSAVLVTKDRDFPLHRRLIELVLRALPAIIDAIERDESVIEFVGR